MNQSARIPSGSKLALLIAIISMAPKKKAYGRTWIFRITIVELNVGRRIVRLACIPTKYAAHASTPNISTPMMYTGQVSSSDSAIMNGIRQSMKITGHMNCHFNRRRIACA